MRLALTSLARGGKLILRRVRRDAETLVITAHTILVLITAEFLRSRPYLFAGLLILFIFGLILGILPLHLSWILTLRLLLGSLYIYTYIYIYIYGSIKGLGWTRICIFGEKIVRIGIPIAVSTAVYDCLGAWASAKQAPRCLVQVPQNTFLDNLYCQNLANFYWNCIGMFCSTSWCCEVLVFSFAVIFDTQHLSCTLYKNILWHTRYCMILPFAKFTSTRSEIEWNRCKNGTGWPGMARILDSITSTSRPYASRLTSTFGI